MALIQGFEYDIFISYRHNDNKNGWVTEFVNHLREELASIMKDPVSIYFDSNLYDGLLETHHVDKSLEGKLKSLVFVPILSQIYCDPKSFAWQHEFCAFNKLAQESYLTREVTLRSGNVASRILPIVIHHLDQEDINIIETETGSKLRSIDFTFRAAGVNRPLRKDDKKEDNANRLSHHDQLNKLANAIKEILVAIKNPGKGVATPIMQGIDTEEKSVDPKSVAVLPFTNLARDAAQDYFAEGIMENVLNQLASGSSLRVISRTSAMRYKNSEKAIPEIARDLGVKFIVEGSAQVHKDKVRISVKLIDTATDAPLWSKIFTESVDDLFDVQDRVAEAVCAELNSSVGTTKKPERAPTKSREAYDLFLKGRHAFNQWSVDGYRSATEFYKQAIKLDPQFQAAYSYLASSYSARMSWNGDLSPAEAEQNISLYLNEAWRLGATDNDYLTKAFVEFFVRKNFAEAEKLLVQALELNANNTGILYAQCYLYCVMGKIDEAQRVLDTARQLDPLTVGYFNYQILCDHLKGDDQQALTTFREAQQLYPTVLRLYDFGGRVHLTIGNYREAIDTIERGFRTSTVRPPSMVAYLAAGHAKMGNTDQAQELLNELIARSNANEKGVNIYLVHASLALGNVAAALLWLAKAKKTNDVDLIWLAVDPLLRDLPRSTSPEFEAAEKHIEKMLHEQLPPLPYHNLVHVRDVVSAADNIASHESVTSDETKMIRIAAWLHDIGFIHGSKDHEARGAQVANELLPQFGFDEIQIKVIANMILATKLPQSPTTALERILCDADLDYLGRDDFYPISSNLFREMQQAGVVENEREWNLVQRMFLQGHKYHTEFAKANREAQKQNRLREIGEVLSRKLN